MQSSAVDPLSSPSRLSQDECERISVWLYNRISLSSDGSFEPTSFLAILKSRMSPLKRRYKQWPVSAADVVWSWAASLPEAITEKLSRSVRGSSCVLDDWRAYSLNQVKWYNTANGVDFSARISRLLQAMSDHEGVETQADGCYEFSHGASSELFRHVWRLYEGIMDPRSAFFMDLAYLAARNLVSGAFLRMSQGRKLSHNWWGGLSSDTLEDISKYFPEGEVGIILQDRVVWQEAINTALKQVEYPQGKRRPKRGKRRPTRSFSPSSQSGSDEDASHTKGSSQHHNTMGSPLGSPGSAEMDSHQTHSPVEVDSHQSHSPSGDSTTSEVGNDSPLKLWVADLCCGYRTREKVCVSFSVPGVEAPIVYIGVDQEAFKAVANGVVCPDFCADLLDDEIFPPGHVLQSLADMYDLPMEGLVHVFLSTPCESNSRLSECNKTTSGAFRQWKKSGTPPLPVSNLLPIPKGFTTQANHDKAVLHDKLEQKLISSILQESKVHHYTFSFENPKGCFEKKTWSQVFQCTGPSLRVVDVNHCAYGHIFLKHTQYFTNLSSAYWVPKGLTGDGRCGQNGTRKCKSGLVSRCLVGYVKASTKRWNHTYCLGQEA